MKKIKTALDIDGCIMDYTELLWVYMPLFCKEHNLPYKPSKEMFYYIKKEFNLTDEQENLFWCTYGLGCYFNEPPRKYTNSIINKINYENESYILTARNNRMTNSFNQLFLEKSGLDYETFTLKYFKKYKLNPTNIYFDCGNKVEHILKLGIDNILEDSPINIKEIYKNTNAVIFVMDNYCNRDILDNDRIVRVFSMPDYYEKLTNYYK